MEKPKANAQNYGKALDKNTTTLLVILFICEQEWKVYICNFFFSLCPDLMYIHYLSTTKEPRLLKMLLKLQENILKAVVYL